MWAKGNGFKRSSATEAFTLIELLTVISIIGVLAAILTGLSGIAASKMRTSRINGELQQLVTAIEGYKAEVGFYPPDNQIRTGMTDLTRAQMNPLYFELTGAIYEKSQFTALSQKDPVAPSELTRAFGVDGINNSAREKRDIKYQGIHFKEAQYAPIVGYNNIFLLTVPVSGPPENMVSIKPPPDGKGGQANVWLYDSSSTNRHNMATFDLWAVYKIGKRVVTSGNWK